MPRKVAFPFSDHTQEIAEFEAIGEQELRYQMAHGSFFGNSQLAETWLQKQAADRQASKEAEDARRAEDQLRLLRQQRNVAVFTAVLAAVATILAALIATLISKP